jgi:(E)-4-hydroxy-3-methylbut-2-enyl-diphosphate synthase
VVADVHFDYRLAVAAIEAGADKVRINPGNIGSEEKVRRVADCAKERGIPIRVGANGGSINPALRRGEGVSADTLCRSAMENITMLERWGFENIVVALKASDVLTTVAAYRQMAGLRDYPLHLGVTEAGTRRMGTIKSAAAFGALLADGIGDTLRVSLTDDPVFEVAAARDILKALGLNDGGVTVISCPTCGRTKVDMIPVAKEIEARTANIKAKLTVAVMGCAVNGPGEAEEADIGVACGKGEGLIFKKGKPLYKVGEEKMAEALMREIEGMTGERGIEVWQER